MAPSYSTPSTNRLSVRKRLFTKTDPSKVIVTVVTPDELAHAISVTKISAADWTEEFLLAAEVGEEDPQRRKAVYLITLPHPQAAGRAAGLKAPGGFTHDDISKIIQDIFAKPIQSDPGSACRRAH